MHRTPGEALLHFATSVDIVGDDVITKVRGMVESYLIADNKHRDRPFRYYEILDEYWKREGNVFERILKTLWTKGSDKKFTNGIRNAQGEYVCQTAYAYANEVPLWITGADGELLAKAKRYEDHWSHCENLPRYQSGNEHAIRTSVILLLRSNDRVFGVFNVESEKLIPPSAEAMAELDLIAKALSILIPLHAARKTAEEGTEEAIGSLREFLGGGVPYGVFSVPHLFFGSSGRADPAVTGAILEVLKEREAQKAFHVYHWKADARSGDVNKHINENILRARFAICYFSEPKGDLTYIDNPNVLFEAGMLYVLTTVREIEKRQWIPIRELASPQIPFNFASERILVVNRNPDGSLNREDFKADLMARLEELLPA
jgi:hypothetical protein